MQGSGIAFGGLKSAQYMAGGAAVISVMEERYIPAGIQINQKVCQCAGALGKFKPVDNFRNLGAGPSAHHMAEVPFGESVMGQVGDSNAFGFHIF